MSKVKIFFPNLDGLRTIAFLFVFSEHILWGAIKDVKIESPFLNHVIYNLFSNGGLGVSIFFVLSGFLITYLILKEIETNGRLDVISFYKRRFLRIWPLYFVLLLFLFFVYPFCIKIFNLAYFVNPGQKWMYFAFLSNFDMIRLFNEGKESFMQTGVTWSVSIEEQFYLVWPLIFLIINKRNVPFIFLFIISFSILFRLIYCSNSTFIYFHTFGVFGDLALGGFLAWLSHFRYDKLVISLPRANSFKLLIYLVGIVFVLSNEFWIEAEQWRAFNRFLSTVYFAYVIADQNFTEGTFLKLSNFKILTTLGKYTYGMYLLHPVAFLFMQYVYAGLNIGYESFFNRVLMAVLSFVITILFSYLSFRIIESPFLKMKSKFAYISKE